MISPTIEIDNAVPASDIRPPETQNLNLARFHRTDSGNAELFAHLFGDRVRFNHLQGQWLIWDTSRLRWTVDRSHTVRTFAIAAARRRLRAAQELALPADDENPRQRKEMNWAVRSESRPLLDATLEIAKSISPVSDPGTEWDNNPFILGVANGLVDLRTGRLREESPSDRVIKHSRVRFDQAAQCPLFEKFLSTIFPGHPEMSTYIQKIMGYCLTGDISEHRVFCNYGKGSNGKSTLTEMIRFLLGDYAVNLPFSALEASRWGNSSTNELVSLYGARFATSSETNDGSRFNEARIKALSGGDPITARALYQNSFTFRPTHKLWLAFNHKPTVTDDTPGFWRRIDMIEYGKEFSGSEKDESFLKKLEAEASGILAFAVRGCVLWAKEGLDRPAFVAEATAGYRQETDVLGEFVAECCVLDDAAPVTSSALWSRYERWSKESGEACLPKRTFLDRLAKQFNLRPERIGHASVRGWAGIRLQLGG
jgi:putative DNA primase/helicase